MTQNTSVGYIPASQTSKTMSILIYDGTPSAGDLTTYDEIYTTPALCFAALPAIINHAVTIKIRKADGSAYAAATLQRVVSGGSITIQGEYYYNNTVASAGSGTGKFNVNASHSGLVQTGDKVLMIKYSGTVGASTPSDAFVDTVAGVSGTEITLTTRTTDAFDATWSYVIVRTEFAGLTVSFTNNVSIRGLFFNSTSTAVNINDSTNYKLSESILTASQTAFKTFNSLSSQWNENIGAISTDATGAYGPIMVLSASLINIRKFFALFSGVTHSYGAIIRQDVGSMGQYYYGCCFGESTGVGMRLQGECYANTASMRIDGLSGANKMSTALSAERGSVIMSGLTFGSNITTQKSPANWAASTDGSYVS